VLLASDSSPKGLNPGQLTVATSEGEVVEETDLTTLFELHRDVLIFDLTEGALIPDEEAFLSPRREYALVTDIDLTLNGIPNVDWRRIGDRKVYRLSPPWSPDVSVRLDELEFWTPNVTSTKPRPRVSPSLVGPSESPIPIGSATRLQVEDIPETTESATLVLGEKKNGYSAESVGESRVTWEHCHITLFNKTRRNSRGDLVEVWKTPNT
jgi:hypothetical protein